MARGGKQGLDYFPFDVDFFDDDKLQLIEAEFGIKGVIIAIKLLCKIYKNGYYYQWGGDQCSLFARKDMGAEVVPAMVEEVVRRLVSRCFFDERCFNSFQILTSSGIQKRFLEAVGRRQKVDLMEELCLVEIPQNINVNILRLNVDINNENASSGTQSKVKESKEEKSKEKNIDVASSDAPPKRGNKETLEERMRAFRADLILWEATYGAQTIEAFYSYWSEPNPSRTKMRSEMEKTWDLARRLNTWHQRSKSYTPNPVKKPNITSYDNTQAVVRF